MKRSLLTLTLTVLSLFSCSAEDPESTTIQTLTGITPANFPIIDGSDSTTPLRTILMCRLLGFNYKWARQPFTQDPDGDLKRVYPDYTCTDVEQHRLRTVCLLENNTHQSHVNLIDGTVELILTARSISRDEKVYADEKGVELIQKPIAHDALTFMVNPSNPIESLTIEQIQKIYMGEITNWSEVGSPDMKLTPYIRNRNSGSQEKFETIVMKDLPLADLPVMQIGTTMMSPYYQLEADPTGLAFTPFYYYSVMVDNGSTKAIGVNGIAMTKANVLNQTYPYCTEIYAAVRSDIDRQSIAYQIFEFLTEQGGQDIIEESGYIPLGATNGIASTRAESLKNGSIHNLQGQRLSNAPQNGIYIKNGKKMIKICQRMK